MPAAPQPAPVRLKLAQLLDPDELDAEVAAGRVRRTQHRTLPLSVYAYGPKCVFDNHWTPVTRLARGLIVDDDTSEVVAVSFPKFFNYDQHQADSPFAPALPGDEPFEVYDKLDGSLGIVFHYRDRWHVATKSAFASEQALWARDWLDTKDSSRLVPGVAYLAEIIYPANRVVVDNGSIHGLVLIGAFGPDAVELPLRDAAPAWRAMGGDAVASHRGTSLKDLVRHAREDRHPDGRTLAGTDAEGWVVRFASGTRVKVKLADYVRLHAAITGTTERGIWTILRSGREPAALFERMPDEFHAWIVATATRLHTAQARWKAEAQEAYHAIGPGLERRAFAERAARSPYRAALFLLLDGRSIDELAWRAVKPEVGPPFRIADL
jgi:RNA ligase